MTLFELTGHVLPDSVAADVALGRQLLLEGGDGVACVALLHVAHCSGNEQKEENQSIDGEERD